MTTTPTTTMEKVRELTSKARREAAYHLDLQSMERAENLGREIISYCEQLHSENAMMREALETLRQERKWLCTACNTSILPKNLKPLTSCVICPYCGEVEAKTKETILEERLDIAMEALEVVKEKYFHPTHCMNVANKALSKLSPDTHE